MRRRGKKKAIVAVGHDILTTAWHLLSRNHPYSDPGPSVLFERSASEILSRDPPAGEAGTQGESGGRLTLFPSRETVRPLPGVPSDLLVTRTEILVEDESG